MARRAGPAAQVQGLREGGALWISVQDPAKAGQVVKNPARSAGQAVYAAKEAMERVAGIQVTV